MMTARPIIVLLALAVPALGANPANIPRYQKNSPDHVHVVVTKVTEKEIVRDEQPYFALDVQAKVTKVVRSKSGLKVGAIIQFRYDVPDTRKSSPFGDWARKVEKGEYKAYLKADKDDPKRYHPSALSGSFVPIKKKGG